MGSQDAPHFEFETAHLACGRFPVAGVDEVGRGPLAGPVVAAAVIVHDPAVVAEARDSKTLSEAKREGLYEKYSRHPQISWGIGLASVQEIDHLNILQATRLAMVRALTELSPSPQMVLVDGRPFKNFPWDHEGIVGGDRKCLSIAAASIMAKVTRDRLMVLMDADYPEYGFAQNKGYGTGKHLDAIHRIGVCPHHRTSFAPCR